MTDRDVEDMDDQMPSGEGRAGSAAAAAAQLAPGVLSISPTQLDEMLQQAGNDLSARQGAALSACLQRR